MDRYVKSGVMLVMAFFAMGAAVPLTNSTLPTFQCTLNNQPLDYNNPRATTATFSRHTPEIFFTCQSDNVVKGDRLKAVWIADITNEAGWNNHEIAEKRKVVHQDLNPLDLFRADLSLNKPCDDWPVGNYHVRLYINEIESYSYEFMIR